MTHVMTVIDVGGTHLRWGRWSAECGLQDRQSVRTAESHQGHLSVVQSQEQLVNRICRIPPREKGARAGVSFGAAMNHFDGTVYASAPLWGAHNIPFDLSEALSLMRPDVEWHVINDVTAALLHASASPLCVQDKKVMLLTISTGIAARTLYRETGVIPCDACGLQGEVGHLPVAVQLRGEPVVLNCDCGITGHLSAYSSGPGIAQMAVLMHKRYPQEWNDSMLGRSLADGECFEAALTSAVTAKDCIALELLLATTLPVADLLRTTLCIAPDVDRIILTGGVAVSLGNHYKAAVMSHLNRQGIYLTSQYHPQWLEDRITIYNADCLIGAGIAAIREAG